MVSDKEQVNPRGSLRLAPTTQEVEEQKAKLPRQFVNFTFYHDLIWQLEIEITPPNKFGLPVVSSVP